MAQNIGEIWRHCADCDYFWRPPADDWTCEFCGEPGLISFVGPELRSAHERPTDDRIDVTWDERWLRGDWNRHGGFEI